MLCDSILLPIRKDQFPNIRTDLEPFILAHEVASLGQTQVVQDCSYCMGFEVTALKLGGLGCDDEAEEPASHAMVLSEVI